MKSLFILPFHQWFLGIMLALSFASVAKGTPASPTEAQDSAKAAASQSAPTASAVNHAASALKISAANPNATTGPQAIFLREFHTPSKANDDPSRRAKLNW